MNKLKNYLIKIIYFVKIIWRVNWIKTLYFNFKVLPFVIAIKLPIIFFGKVKFISLKGNIIFKTNPFFSMAEFGNSLEIIQINKGISEIRLDGTFCINGSFKVGYDYSFHIFKFAYLEVGDNSYFGALSKIITTNNIILGRSFRFGYESQISDSNYHYLINLDNNSVTRLSKKIFIEDFCWVGNRTSIMPGTITPRFITIASNSVVNKDYREIIPENSLIGGTPAKLIKNNVVRVFDSKSEIKINDFFKKNPENEFYYM